jgi:hypothetical protein
MFAYVVLVEGHVRGIYTSAVDAQLQAKSLNASVEQCRLNSEVASTECSDAFSNCLLHRPTNSIIPAAAPAERAAQ